MKNLNPYAKSVVTGIMALVAALMVVITGNETLADVTFAEWLAVAAAVLATSGVVYAVPNRPKK